MDYLDRFFEPGPRPSSVVAMEPTQNPADYYAPAPERSPQPDLVRTMEPVAGPADYGTVRERGARQSAARGIEAPRPSLAPPAPATDPESRTRLIVRENPWLTQFWMELTPAQQGRVERQLQRGNLRLTAGGADPAAIWDPMGLADRVGLIFGRGIPMERPAPTDGRNRPTFAGNS